MLGEALAARDRLLRAEERVEELRISYHQSIRRLHAGGASMREIAEALGLSHQRVHQIVNGGGDMTPTTPRRKVTLLRRLTGAGRKGGGAGKSCDGGGGDDRLYVDARDAMAFARDEARTLGHDYLGTEHVLLGLIRAEGGLAARMLTAMGVDLWSTREAVERKLGTGGGARPAAVPPTDRVKKVLGLGLREAKEHRSTHVRSEHLLLAIAREGEGVGARILAERGIVYRSLRRRVDRAARACSFCGRSGIDVDHLVAGPGVHICEHCVGTAGKLAAQPAPEGSAEVLHLVSDRDGAARCDFCGRHGSDVDRLVADHAGHAVCDRCLALCREIHEEERRG
jgi:hypothetical protein